MAADAITMALRSVCPSARPAGSGDAVAGTVPGHVATPADVGEASALLRVASEHGLAVVPRGSGSKLDWGAPPRRCDLVIDTLGLGKIVEHSAGDLVARVQAGVRMEDLASMLAAAGQQLALDPPPAGGGTAPDAATGAVPGTIGGVIATGAAGPRRLRYGTPRDLVIGVTVVRADGTVARSGGKVVKNVAGYDLGKLFAGSWGTLGLITEAVVRLHPRPAAAAFILVECDDAAAAHRAAATAGGSDLAPSAVEVDLPGRGHPIRVGVLLEGDPSGVEERSAALVTLLGPGATAVPSAPPWWGMTSIPRAAGGGADTVVKLAFWPAALPGVLTAIARCGQAAGLDPAVGGSAVAGVVYAALSRDADPAAVAGFVACLRDALARGEGEATPPGAHRSSLPPAMATAQVLRAPPAVAGLADLWGPVPSLPLMRAVKDQFDPAGLMAPGRFAGGI